jgi:hypothetical protein
MLDLKVRKVIRVSLEPKVCQESRERKVRKELLVRQVPTALTELQD